MTTQYTPNFRLNLPDFRMGPWHDLVNGNTTKIDQLLFSIYQGVDTSPWRNNTDYTSGQTALDETDNSFWVAIVNHTSAGIPTTFAEDRAANPGYWNRVVVGIAPRGEWENDQHYLPNDMVSDSVEHVIGVCKTEHQSNTSGTIRDDEVYWTFIADIGDTAAIAATVEYDNTASGTTATNLQDTTDELYASAELQESEIAANASQIAANTVTIGNNTSRINALETSDAAQNAAIVDNASDITNLDTRVTAAEGAISGHETRIDNLEAVPAGIPEAPSDGKMYARKNVAWAEIKASAVLVSDTPPVGADPNTLWWESDSGSLYINYVDVDTTQWVLVGAPGAGGMTQNSVRFDAPQGLSVTQKMQALMNIDAQKYSEFNIVQSVVGGALTIALKNTFGDDPSPAAPIYMKMKNGSGSSVWRIITAPISVTVPSGATLGVLGANYGFRIWFAAFDDAGTIRLAVRCCSDTIGGYKIICPNENITANTVSPPGNNAHIWYTSTGAVALGNWKFIGFATWEQGLAVLGTWIMANMQVKLDDTNQLRPGMRVQWLYDQNAIAVSKTDTNLTAVKSMNVTLLSAANIIKLSGQGYTYIRTGSGGQGTHVFTANGGIISNQSANMYQAAVTDAITFPSLKCVHRPIGVGPITYAYCCQNIGSGAALIQYQFDGFEIEELMT